MATRKMKKRWMRSRRMGIEEYDDDADGPQGGRKGV
jgi:hypothetical protein